MIDFDAYEALTETRPYKKLRAKPTKPRRRDAIAALVEPVSTTSNGARLGFGPKLNVTSEEQAWLQDNLSPFFNSGLLISALRRVKGGKEANVYCCSTTLDTGSGLIAAKVYRPRQFRNLKNDGVYRQGRAVLDGTGKKVSDWRLLKAIAQKSRVGLEAQQISWVEYEFQVMLRLRQAGADVPVPYRNSDHVILMEYLGEEHMPAPILNQVTLPSHAARPLFDRLLHNVEIMLAQGCVHGDLSAYNVLYWGDRAAIIDFPQIVDPRANPDARTIFGRDVERLCQYFARYGVKANAAELAQTMWQKCT